MADETSIIASAQGLFHRFGIMSVTMDDVAHHLGISKKTLYCTAQNKDALVEKPSAGSSARKRGLSSKSANGRLRPCPSFFP